MPEEQKQEQMPQAQLAKAAKPAQKKKYTPQEIKQALGPGVYIKYSDMTVWDEPDEGGPDLYIFVPELDPDEF